MKDADKKRVVITRYLRRADKKLSLKDFCQKLSSGSLGRYCISLDFSGVNLKNQDMSYVIFDNLNFASAILTNVKLSKANLGNSNLNAAKLNKSKIEYTFLSNASLCNTDLSSALLETVNLQGATLNRADLKQAILSNVNFEEATFLETDFRGASVIDPSNLKSTQLLWSKIEGVTVSPTKAARIFTEASKKQNYQKIEKIKENKAQKQITQNLINKFKENLRVRFKKICTISDSSKKGGSLKLRDKPQTIDSRFKPVTSEKIFLADPHSLEVYSAEFEKHWTAEYIELCIKSENAEPLKNYIKSKLQNKELTPDEAQWLILCVAVYGTRKQVKDLAETGLVDVQMGTSGGLTIMHIAALKGDEKLFNVAQELGISATKKATFGAYSNVEPIHCAILGNHLHLFMELKNKTLFSVLRYQQSVAQDDYVELGWLALAVHTGKTVILKELLESSEDVLAEVDKVQSPEGGNVLHLAVRSFQQSELEMLLSKEYFRAKKYLEGTNTDGLTPLALAAKLGNITALKLLKEKKALLQQATQSTGKFKDYTPLHLAVESGEEVAVECLLIWGVNINRYCVVDGKRITAVQLAEKRKEEATSKATTAVEFDQIQMFNRQAMRYGKIATRLERVTIQNVLGKFEPTTDKKVIYKNLVFKGGGPKGIVYVGALIKLLEKWEGNPELKDLETIERVAGTSAGAIMAVLLAVGYTPQEINKLLRQDENHPSKYLDGKPLNLLSQKTMTKKAFTALKDTVLHPMQMGAMLVNLFRTDSICSGDYFLKLIEKHIQIQTGLVWCTFGELKKKIYVQTKRTFRHLHVVTIQVKPTTQIEVLSSEDPKYDNYTIAHAIRASMSIPILYKPANLYQLKISADGTREPEKVSDAEYIDGGVLANYPLKLFDQAQYTDQGLHLFRDESSKTFPVYNEETLGFYIKPETPLANPVYDKDGKINMGLALKVLYTSAEDRVYQLEQSERRSIEIDNAGVTLFDFDLTKNQLDALFKAGGDAVEHSKLITTFPPQCDSDSERSSNDDSVSVKCNDDSGADDTQQKRDNESVRAARKAGKFATKPDSITKPKNHNDDDHASEEINQFINYHNQ